MRAQAIDSVDTWLLETVDHHRNRALTWFARTLMDVGHTVPGVTVCVLLGLTIVIALRLWRPSIAVVIAFLIAGQIADLLKNVIDRPRPPASLAIVPAYGFSMPSSVAAASSAAAIALLITCRWDSPLTRRRFTLALVAALAVIGASMVYLGAHWASDVVAGWVLGSAIGAGVGFVCRGRTKSRASLSGRETSV